MSFRLNPGVLDKFRSTCVGWETRIDDSLYKAQAVAYLGQRFGPLVRKTPNPPSYPRALQLV
ncbi:hypothetical protein AA105894_2535 [Asaia spathodeae NBRC 105894]|uniref:Uncharacterized protein n=1 Tax=Asaia spathodeae TaxID=657016 RepID=A0ABX2P860_9PROT|nr:hypothetical protein AA105894_2535 [Asaia spathodeae NBRC 105894]